MSSEKLFQCPRCGQNGFTHRGLVAHRTSKRCTKATPLPMAKPIKKESNALVILSDPSLKTPDQIDTLQKEVVHHLREIPRLEREAAARAILAGLTLWKAKESVGHGNFREWMEQMSTTGGHLVGKTQCNYYMRLARVFLDKVRGLSRGTIIAALAGGQLELSLADPTDEARSLFSSISEFVGEASLNELLAKHGITEKKTLGGKREKGEDDQDQGTATPEQLAFSARESLTETLERAERLLFTENQLQYLHARPEEVKGIVAGFRDLADRLEKQASAILKKR